MNFSVKVSVKFGTPGRSQILGPHCYSSLIGLGWTFDRDEIKTDEEPPQRWTLEI